MARWQEIVDVEPTFAAAVRSHLDARTHKTIATLRADGSPRISGIEAFFAEGELWFGSMPDARKAVDLRRDPRFALHSGSADPPDWSGDSKLDGRAEEVHDPERRRAILGRRDDDAQPPDAHLFRAEIDAAVLIGLNDARDRLVIEVWRPGRGLRRMERT